jgi:hypothetical protein
VGRQRVYAVQRVTPRSKGWLVLAVALLVGSACGEPGTATEAIAVATSAEPVVSAGPETVAMCESFLADVVGGTIALVEFSFADDTDTKLGTTPFVTSNLKLSGVIFSSLRNEVQEGELQVVSLFGGAQADQIVGMRKAVGDNAQVTGLLIPSQIDEVAQPRLAAMIVGDQFVSGDVCSDIYTARLQGAAGVLKVDLVTMVQRANSYYNDPGAGENSDTAWALGRFTDGRPSEPIAGELDPTPVELWNNTPVENRMLDWSVMPDDIKAKVDVYGIVVNLPPDFFFGDLLFRCDLGVGYGTVTNFEGDRPAAATLCTGSPTQVEFTGQLTSFPPETWNRDFGNRVSLSADAGGNVIVTVETLAPGELEKITGLTREQLEEQRDLVKAGEFASP